MWKSAELNFGRVFIAALGRKAPSPVLFEGNPMLDLRGIL